MTAPILVGHDPASRDPGPVRFAAFAAQVVGAPVVVVSVHRGSDDQLGSATGESVAGTGADADRALESLRREAPALAGVSAELRSVGARSAAHGLHSVAESEGAGLIVVGRTNRSRVGRSLIGSTAERVIHGAPCPVAVVPEDLGEPRLDVLGVAFVPSPEGTQALQAGSAVARATGARLRVVSLLEPEFGAVEGAHADPRGVRANEDREQAAASHKARMDRVVAEALAAASAPGEPQADVLFGEPEQTLIDVSRHVDLLVMGSRGYGPRRAVLLGGVSRGVVAAAECAVVVLPRGVERPLANVIDRVGAHEVTT